MRLLLLPSGSLLQVVLHSGFTPGTLDWIRGSATTSVCVSCSVVSDSFMTPWTVAHQAHLFMEFSRPRILEWATIPFSGVSSQPRDRTHVSHTAGRFFTIWATWEAPATTYWTVKCQEVKTEATWWCLKRLQGWGFHGGSVVKNLPVSAGDMGSSLIQEDPTWRRAAGPTCRSYSACALQLLKPTYVRACAPKQEEPLAMRIPAPQLESSAPLAATREKPEQQLRPSTAQNK